jgi:hypothetical protein
MLRPIEPGGSVDAMEERKCAKTPAGPDRSVAKARQDTTRPVVGGKQNAHDDKIQKNFLRGLISAQFCCLSVGKSWWYRVSDSSSLFSTGCEFPCDRLLRMDP